MTSQRRRLVLVCAVVITAAVVMIAGSSWLSGAGDDPTERRETPVVRQAPGSDLGMPTAGD